MFWRKINTQNENVVFKNLLKYLILTYNFKCSLKKRGLQDKELLVLKLVEASAVHLHYGLKNILCRASELV